MASRIKSADIKPGDIIKFEFGDYGNWITVRIDEVHYLKDSATYYPQKLIWHYLSDETQKEAPKDCRAEKRGNNPTSYPRFTCYSNPNDLVEKLN